VTKVLALVAILIAAAAGCSPPPQPVPVASQIVAGDHSCALVTGGRVKCWGGNDKGQLGNGSNVDSNVPVNVSGITGATQVSSGDHDTCALVGGGRVKCWGWNDFGQLGDRTTTDRNLPV
jgi:alpha-tubulin suppressor-like RCC1 family protein